MKLRLLFIFSIFIALESAGQQMDSTVVRPARSGIAFSVDYGKILTLASDFESKWEVGIGYQYKSRLLLNVQVGTAKLEPAAYDNGTYLSEGQYGTVGLNYLMPINASSMIYFGAQYGMSMYEDQYTYTVGSRVWPDFNDGGSRSDLEATWFAAVIGSEQRINNLNDLTFGFEFNLRVLQSYDEFEPVDTYSIPGYGKTIDNTAPALNLYIKYLLEF